MGYITKVSVESANCNLHDVADRIEQLDLKINGTQPSYAYNILHDAVEWGYEGKINGLQSALEAFAAIRPDHKFTLLCVGEEHPDVYQLRVADGVCRKVPATITFEA